MQMNNSGYFQIPFRGRWKFPQVKAIENFAVEDIFHWVLGIWQGMILTIPTFFKAKNKIP